MVHGEYNSTTHPIVKLEDDWNDMERTGHEKTASYIIRKNGSYYEAIQGGTSTGAGTIAFGGAGSEGSTSGTDFSAVLQAALLNGKSVMIKPIELADPSTVPYTLNTKVTLYACNKLFGGGSGSYIAAKTDLNDYMFQLDTNAHDVHVSNLRFYGNGANQSGAAASNGILYGNGLMYDIYLNDLAFYTWKGDAIQFTGVNHSFIDRCVFDSYGTAAVRGTNGVNWINGVEGQLNNIVTENIHFGVVFTSGNRMNINNYSAGHGAYDANSETALKIASCDLTNASNILAKYWNTDNVLVTGCDHVNLSNINSQYSNTGNLLTIYDCTHVNLNNAALNHAVTLNGLYLGGTTTDCEINNVQASNCPTGVYEANTSDRNTFSNINTYLGNTTGITRQGANSVVSRSWNKTSWIESSNVARGSVMVGTGTNTGSSAHGLSFSPGSVVFATLQDNGGTLRPYYSWDATNVTVTLAGGNAGSNLYFSYIAYK
jgi:hypothetical protein